MQVLDDDVTKMPIEALALTLILRSDYPARHFMTAVSPRGDEKDKPRVLSARGRASFSQMRAQFERLGFHVPFEETHDVFYDVWCELARMYDVKMIIEKDRDKCLP